VLLLLQIKAGDKIYILPQHTYGGAGGERRYSSYSFMTSALDGGEWSVSSVSHPGRTLALGKGPPKYPLDRRLGGPQRVGLDTEARGKILSPLPGIEPQSPGCPARRQTLH
jgi:hypothetical protein